LAKGGIAVHPTPRLYLPGGSIGLTIWLQFAIAYFGLDRQIFPSPGGPGTRTYDHGAYNLVYLPNDI